MELALSLGETPKPFQFLGKSSSQNMVNKDLGFCMGIGTLIRGTSDQIRLGEEKTRSSSDQPLQLDLLPFSPVPRSQPSSRLRLPWLKDNLLPEPGNSSNGQGRGLGLSRPSEERENGAFLSSFQNQMDSSVDKKRKRDLETMSISTEYDRDQKGGGSSSRGSDEEEEDNGLTRKKLRLSKEQSAFLEESFKEHNTLNPKQKVDLAKQLKLRPRQVEVWFQNRRARTKLKQTEVDCEYLKRCYETLTQENRRLQKEVQELKVLKTSQPFYNHLPPTTLTICLSCERPPSTVAAATTTRH